MDDNKKRGKLQLKDELTIVEWMRSNKLEIAKKNRKEVSDLLFTDKGLQVNPASLNRFFEASGVECGYGREKRGENNSISRDVCLAKILRKIGRELGVLSFEEDADLSLLVARRYGDKEKIEDS